MLSFCSCSSMVLQRALPFVSGKKIRKNPHKNIANPKVPKDRNSFLLPAEVNNGSNTVPSTTACLASDVAELLTLTGNNSVVYISHTLYAKHEQNKDASSSPICMPSLPRPKTTQSMLNMPLAIQETNNEPLLFHLSIKTKDSKFEGINVEALNTTLKYMLKPKFPAPTNMPKNATPMPNPSAILANIRFKAHPLLHKSFITL